MNPIDDQASMTMESLYLRRPTPEYGQAFDLATAPLTPLPGPMLAVFSSPAHIAEVLKRCPGPVDFAGAGSFDVARFVDEARAWAWGAIGEVSLERTTSTYADLLWVEPEETSARKIAHALRRLAAPNAELKVMASSFLRRYLPAWHRRPPPAVRPLTPGATMRVLRAEGWRIESVTAFHGPRAIVWGSLRRAAETLGRPDWGDRCLWAMRAHYREPGWLWPLAPLALIRAQAA